MVDIVLGITGSIGAGKDTAADYLKENYDFVPFSTGDYLRSLCKKEGKKSSRENAIKKYNELLKKYGPDYVPKQVTMMLDKSGSKFVIFNGIRTRRDFEFMREYYGEKFKLLMVDADDYKRSERMIKRARPGDPKNDNEFWQQEKHEHENYPDLEWIHKQADFDLNNNATIEDLKVLIDEILMKLKII